MSLCHFVASRSAPDRSTLRYLPAQRLASLATTDVSEGAPVNPDDPVGALVERTLANLRILDELPSQLASEGQPFEVTQMVNSLLSLLVVPRELGTVEFVGRSGPDPHVFANGIRKW